MNSPIKSVRPFIGARDFSISRSFYGMLGFEEVELGAKMSLFRRGDFGFYLQDYYAKDWIDNTMVFLEVVDADGWLNDVQALDLPARFKGVKLSKMVVNDWGQEFFLHDPSGVLWHIGEFR